MGLVPYYVKNCFIFQTYMCGKNNGWIMLVIFGYF